MLAISSWIVLLIHMAPCIFARYCSVNVSNVHHKFINEMISTQANICEIPVKILHTDNVTGNCDLWALIYEVHELLEKLKFTPGTENYKTKSSLLITYIDCYEKLQQEELDAIGTRLQTRNMNAVGILQRVNDSLHKLNRFQPTEFPLECLSHNTHGQNTITVPTGPHCTCPSPTTSVTSSETSQTSLSYLSELTTSFSFHTSRLAEGMSGSYPEKLTSPQKNSQALDSSPSISTDMPSDINRLTTIVDHSYADAAVQSEAYTDFPITNSDFPIHTTEFTKGILYVSLNPSQTRTDPEQVRKDTSLPDMESMNESRVSPAIENTSLPTDSLINGESSTVMERDEIQETTMSEFGSQSPKGSLFQSSLSVPSEEPGIDTSSMSVTKIRRSLVNMDEISSASVTRQAASSLSTRATDTNFPFKNPIHTITPSSRIGLSNTEAPEPVSQGKVIEDKNLGWASSFLASTMLTTKTEQSMSSPVPGGKLFPSDVTHKPVFNAHKLQQESDIAIDGRQSNFPGPNHSSNMLPIIATENSDGRQKRHNESEHNQSNLQIIIIVILVAFVLLLLCGLLYYRHQCRVLERRLTTSCDPDLTRNPDAVLPEERVHLQVLHCEMV